MYWFGEVKEEGFNWQDEVLWKGLSLKRRELARTKLGDILNLLDQLSKEDFSDALPGLLQEATFHEGETRKTLALLPGLLKRESLERRLRGEFTRIDILDQFAKLPNATNKVKAIPNGIVLHVTAGNVFLSAIDSLLMGFVTKNISVLKVSSHNKFFPEYFAKKLKHIDKKNLLSDKFAILHWKGGDTQAEDFVKAHVNTIIAWGGEEMIASYQKNLPLQVKFLDFGPKISIQVISKAGLTHKDLSIVAQKVVADILPWDQSACASPQNLYIQEGVDETSLMLELDKAFRSSPPRGHVDEDEATEILKETYRGYYSELMEGGALQKSEAHLLHLEKNKLLKPSPLHRSLIIKRFQDDQELADLLRPFSFYLQSCSYLVSDEEKDSYLSELSLTGIKRLAPLGTITWGMEGAPHDGRFVLRELVTFVGLEERIQDYGEQASSLQTSSDVKKLFESTAHPPGFIFSSGGTTGEPKFLHFSYEEFDYMSDMLAENLRQQGIKPGMTVANLFVAGNLWSSFMCVEKALEKIGAIQLPIGGMCSQENILTYLKKFKPDVVMGIPSMLVLTAEFIADRGDSVEVPIVFYAGEAMSDLRRQYLAKTWKTIHFGSAGYASVDAGVIGYQCSHCEPGEHHVFSDLIDLKIIEDEGVVTSMARKSMNIDHYRTGDRMEWIGACKCGSSDKRFRLLGRIDNVIQIWSCRLLTSDVEAALSDFGIITYQLKISEAREANVVREKLALLLEHSDHEIDREKLLLEIYERSRDVKDTISFMDFKKDLSIEMKNHGEIQRNPRTGKISVIVDQRK